MNKNLQSQALFEFITLVYEKISGTYTSSFREVLSPLQYYTICVIYYYKEISMTSLADSMKMPKQNMTKIIDKLFQMDFVKRVKDSNDKRIIKVSLSQAGINFLINHVKLNSETICDSLSKTEDVDIEEFFNALNCINKVLSKITIDEKIFD